MFLFPNFEIYVYILGYENKNYYICILIAVSNMNVIINYLVGINTFLDEFIAQLTAINPEIKVEN